MLHGPKVVRDMQADHYACVEGDDLDTETAYRLIVGCVAPRPVAWITTVDDGGRVNAAPFSSYNYVATSPPMLAVNIATRPGSGHAKDTARNIARSGEFVVNVATEYNMELMHRSAQEFAPDVSEVDALGIALLPSRHVKPPRIAISPVQMECRLDQAIALGRGINTLYIGEIVAFHLSRDVYDGRRVDTVRMRPIARLAGPCMPASARSSTGRCCRSRRAAKAGRLPPMRTTRLNPTPIEPKEHPMYCSTRRSLLRWLVFSAAAAGISSGLQAQTDATYPSRIVTLINPYAAGGPADTLARALAQQLQARLNQTVIVDNKAGGAATIGTGFVARAKPDGYTLLVGTSAGHVVTPLMQRGVPYDGIADFAFITVVANQPNVLVVHPDVGVDDVHGLIARARKEPGKLNYASAGMGGATHLGAEAFLQRAQIRVTHVPYSGAAPAIKDLLGGQVQMGMLNLAATRPSSSKAS